MNTIEDSFVYILENTETKKYYAGSTKWVDNWFHAKFYKKMADAKNAVQYAYACHCYYKKKSTVLPIVIVAMVVNYKLASRYKYDVVSKMLESCE